MDLEAEMKKVLAAQKRLARIQSDLRGGEIEATSPDRTITIVTSTTGQIRDLKLTSDALDRHNASSLERELLKLIQGAQQAATQVTEQALQQAFPEISLADLGLDGTTGKPSENH